MPVLALNGPHADDTLIAPLPLHLTPWTAAALESLLRGRSGRLSTEHLPALAALARERATDADLHELLRTVREDGEARVAFL
ncbi:MAG: hypothetical protein RJA99_3021 [Pseudomonadota bacterium]|jgi:hypothetical protein